MPISKLKIPIDKRTNDIKVPLKIKDQPKKGKPNPVINGNKELDGK